MIDRLVLHEFRSFAGFEMPRLGQVNLIVGKNNSGKTSILEAIHLLTGVGELNPLQSSLIRRGEDYVEERSNTRNRMLDVRRLFHGFSDDLGSKFLITGFAGDVKQYLKADVIESPVTASAGAGKPTLFSEEPPEDAGTGGPRGTALLFHWASPPLYSVNVLFAMGPRGGVSTESARWGQRPPEAGDARTHFITAAALSPEMVVSLFDEVVLTPEEGLVLQALQIIEPSIERIASSSNSDRMGRRHGVRGGMLVRCQGVKERIPIGSMGDGIWRLLGLALALVRSEGGGYLLVDEIDTGLHASTMEDMWRLVYETAKRLNVQVFATTHSRDCYESLAVLCKERSLDHSDVMIHRVERGKNSSVTFSEKEIIVASRRGVEVR